MNPAKPLLIALLNFLLLLFCTSKDTILVNESIKDGEFIVSDGGNFTLGFFNLANSSSRYVGIWYTEVPDQSIESIVWVANRDTPINDTSGVLSIDDRGNLVLHNKYSSDPVWSANASVPSPRNSMAKILDSGNFVLLQQDSDMVLWESFRHPAQVMLPFMGLGLDKRTGLKWFITSWKSQDDPGTGNWSYWYDTNGAPQTILSDGQSRKWRSGPWDGLRWNGMPDLPSTLLGKGTFTDNETENSAAWGTRNSSIITILLVDNSGYVKRFNWLEKEQRWNEFWSAPKEPCDVYQHCGTNGNCNPYIVGQFECTCLPGFEPKSPDDWRLRVGSAGCVRKRGALTYCQSGEGFVKVENAKIPDPSSSLVDLSMDLNKCEQECLKSCSCAAYSSARGSDGTGCIMWHGDLNDTRVYVQGGQDLYVRVDADELALYVKQSKKHANKKRMLTILVTSLAVTVILVIATLFWLQKGKRSGWDRQPRDCEKDEFDENENPSLPIFDASTIIAATDDFSAENKLGQGGFGSVYKGRLPNGQDIAVKRLSATSRQGIEEFKNEVRLISKLQHKNLVRLFGCSIHKEEKMLVYEYLPNRSLDFFIFDYARRSLLDWTKRFEIIFGIARGLLYLHQDSRLKIIHRDLKASNVLLDAGMHPKISDFGMARIFGEDQTEAMTNRVVGTYGYMSPEYAMDGLYSIKSDVFSYGVLILEIISGRRNNDHQNDSPSPNLIGHAWDLWREGKALEMVDSLLGQSYHADEALRCIQIGLLCVQESPTDRPSMLTTVFMLGNETSLPSPNKPAFISKRKHFLSDSSTGRAFSSSNSVTITNIEGR